MLTQIDIIMAGFGILFIMFSLTAIYQYKMFIIGIIGYWIGFSVLIIVSNQIWNTVMNLINLNIPYQVFDLMMAIVYAAVLITVLKKSL